MKSEIDKEIDNVANDGIKYGFDNSKYFLGKVCKHNHVYKDSGKSLRYLMSGACIECKLHLWERLPTTRDRSGRELFNRIEGIFLKNDI